MGEPSSTVWYQSRPPAGPSLELPVAGSRSIWLPLSPTGFGQPPTTFVTQRRGILRVLRHCVNVLLTIRRSCGERSGQWSRRIQGVRRWAPPRAWRRSPGSCLCARVLRVAAEHRPHLREEVLPQLHGLFGGQARLGGPDVEEVGRDVVEVARREARNQLAVPPARAAEREDEPAQGACDADVEEPPLLGERIAVAGGFGVGGGRDRAGVGQDLLLEADDEDVVELEPVGGVQGHERDGSVVLALVLGAVLEIGERDARERVGEARRCPGLVERAGNPCGALRGHRPALIEQAGFVAWCGDDVVSTVTRALRAAELAPNAALEAGDGADRVADVVDAEVRGPFVPAVGPDRLLHTGAAEERLGPARDGRETDARCPGRGL